MVSGEEKDSIVNAIMNVFAGYYVVNEIVEHDDIKLSSMYGEITHIKEQAMPAIEIILESFINKIEECLGPGVAVEIRMNIPEDYFYKQGIACYTDNVVMMKDVRSVTVPIYYKDKQGDGYFFCGRIVT